MNTFAIILLVIVGAITLFEVSSFVFTLIKKHKDKNKLKEESGDDRHSNSSSDN